MCRPGSVGPSRSFPLNFLIPDMKIISSTSCDHDPSPRPSYSYMTAVTKERRGHIVSASQRARAPSHLASRRARAPPIYWLYGICCHVGSSMSSGHYVSYVRREQSASSTKTGPALQDGVLVGGDQQKNSKHNTPGGASPTSGGSPQRSPIASTVWFRCDDEEIVELEDGLQNENSLQEQAYILFYRKQTISSSNLINYTHLKLL